MADRIQIGDTFGELTAIRRIPKNNMATTRWECSCSCGDKIAVVSGSLRNGNTRSCGCKTAFWRSGKHGLSHTREYNVWYLMRERCENPNARGFKSYGGRGIAVCKRWSSFENFYADMGKRPDGTTLERIDNNGNYSKRNCMWGTKQQQYSNRSNTIRITFNGVTKTFSEWSRYIGVSKASMRWRLKRWALTDALTKPGK